MDEKELDEQFQEMEDDTQVQAAEAATAQATPKKKRITMADLKKQITKLESRIEEDVLAWCGQLDIRLERLEATTSSHNAALLSGAKTRLDVLDKGIAILQRNQSSLVNSYTSLSEDIASLPSPATIEDIADRLDAFEGAIAAIAAAFKQHLEEAQPGEPAAAQEIEFAQPPQQTAGGQSRKSDIEAVASVCLHMTDVLMICRVLKATPDLPDEDRTYLLTIACRAAGVTLSPGLQIRAGVREVEV